MRNSRRQFLTASAATAALLADTAVAQSAATTATQQSNPAPEYAKFATSTTLKVGVIGAGWFGKLNLNALMNIAPVDVVALCDVDSRMLQEAAALTLARRDVVRPVQRAPALYADYRQMLAKHAFDVVIIGTPDHWHTLPALAAMEAGADLYLEKPVCVDLEEGHALVRTARRTGRVVQAGTQRRATVPHREAKAHIVDAGLLGEVGLVETFCYFQQRPAQRAADVAVPQGLDWNAWSGPAPLRTYRADMHPRGWRAYPEYGNGYMGDVGVHMLDLARFLMGLGAPKRVSSSGGVYVGRGNDTPVPDTQTASFEYDKLLMTWTNRHWGAPPPGEPWGVTVHGTRGVLKVGAYNYRFEPAGGGKPLTGQQQIHIQRYPQDKANPAWEQELIEATRANMADFLAARATRARPASDIEENVISTSMCILANMALQLGQPVDWSVVSGTNLPDPAVAHWASRPYRAPWVHPSA
jgi:predicted dehydrogenase